MAQYKVVVINPGYESYDIERSLLEPVGAEVLVAEQDCNTEDRVIATAGEADAILVREGPVTRRVIESLDKLKVIARYGRSTRVTCKAGVTEFRVAMDGHKNFVRVFDGKRGLPFHNILVSEGDTMTFKHHGVNFRIVNVAA